MALALPRPASGCFGLGQLVPSILWTFCPSLTASGRHAATCQVRLHALGGGTAASASMIEHICVWMSKRSLLCPG